MVQGVAKHVYPISARLMDWFREGARTRNVAIVLGIASLISVMMLYTVISHADQPLGIEPGSVLTLILVNLVLLLSLVGIVARRIVRLIIARRQGSTGSRLQTKIVVMSSLITVVPSLFIGLFSILFFNFGIQAWFNERVSTAIEESVAVAQGYLEEHKKIIRADVLGMANDLNREALHLKRATSKEFNRIVAVMAGIRKVPEALVFQSGHQKRIIARTNFTYALEFTLEELSGDIMSQAAQGELVTLTSEKDDRVIALTKLDNYFDTYLLVGRFVDNKIINHIEFTRGASNEYQKLKSDIGDLQVQFFLVFVIVALLLLVGVVWYGILFSAELVRPVSALVSATKKVKEGDWSVRVEEGPENDEIASLTRAFNSMTGQLEAQRDEIVSIQTRAAWADVARRVAHEIKNPLTPIHLAAERLKRKYSNQVDDKETFQKYTNTVIRHVEDIGRMVEEFVSYARMPAPDFANNDISRILKEAVFSRECGNAEDIIEVRLPDESVMVSCDDSQMARVFGNLIKNAEEALTENGVKQEGDNPSIKVSLVRLDQDQRCEIAIEDNGKGFPQELFDRLTEPYVTTKTKGTGLGLAIVKKIVEDHGGTISFENTKQGAKVTLSLNIIPT